MHTEFIGVAVLKEFTLDRWFCAWSKLLVSFSKNQFNALFDFSSLKSIHVNFTKYFIGELILRIHICRVLSINFHVLNFVIEVHSQKSNLCCFLF